MWWLRFLRRNRVDGDSGCNTFPYTGCYARSNTFAYSYTSTGAFTHAGLHEYRRDRDAEPVVRSPVRDFPGSKRN